MIGWSMVLNGDSMKKKLVCDLCGKKAEWFSSVGEKLCFECWELKLNDNDTAPCETFEELDHEINLSGEIKKNIKIKKINRNEWSEKYE